MLNYILRRLFLLPLTLFAIILVNFVVLNLAPNDPVNATDISSTGEANRQEKSASENHYLQFREHYGLTLPIVFNLWPSISAQELKEALQKLSSDLKASELHALNTTWGDKARFIMPLLLQEAKDPQNSFDKRKIAANLFIRGATKQGFLGRGLSKEQKELNRKISADNIHLHSLTIGKKDPSLDEKVEKLGTWFEKNKNLYPYPLSFNEKVKLFFFETRFCRYLSKVVTLDFGHVRNDNNKKVIDEVAKRLKYSLTLAVIPMLITFTLCQVFGMYMALHQNKWQDVCLNTFFLILFAIPIFVVAPFLIEKIAMGRSIPFTDVSLPISGFHSDDTHYQSLTSAKRLFDITLHLFLPLIAVTYGTLAIQSRLSRTTILEVLRQDFVRMAKAKGLETKTILIKHVGRNAAITIVTALATSLGVVLSGSLIVETVFEINGFGRFFYEAIVNHDYNVMLFSVFAGSLLTIIGYLLADICYTILDPRVSYD